MTAPARTDWPAIVLAVGAGVVAAFQVGKAPIALPAIRADLSLDFAAASWVLSVLTLLGAVAGGLAGSVVTRFGARRLLPAALLLLAAASLGGALAPGLGSLLATRVVEGLGLLITVIAAPSLIPLAARPEDRHLAFALWGCFMPFGMAVAMMAAPAVGLIGWRGLWLAMAVLLALYALLAHLRLPRFPHGASAGADSGRPLADLLSAVRARGPALLAVTFACYTAAYVTLTGFLPSLLIDRMGVSPGTAGMLAAAVTGANILGNLATGPLLAAGVARWLPISAAALIIALCSPLIFAPAVPPIAAYGLAIVVSAVGGLLPGSVLSGMAVLAPQPRLVPVTLGLAMQGSNLGQLLGPAVAGFVVASQGWQAAGWTLAMFGAAAFALALVLRRLQAASTRPPSNPG